MPKYLIVFALLVFCAGVLQAQNDKFNVELEKRSSDVPDSTNFSTNYPNPFCPATDLKFNIREQSPVKINLYDDKVSLVAILYDGMLQPGKYEIQWNASPLTSGVYYYELVTATTKDTKKIVLVK